MKAEGLVPSLLVFIVLFIFPQIYNDLPGHQGEMRAMQVSRAEREAITS